MANNTKNRGRHSEVRQQKTNGGFTVIEVMIVMAIAGLIMLTVFLAIPAVQRNSRNAQRKSDASAALSSVSNYLSNHNGKLPVWSGTLRSSFGDTTTRFSYYTADTIQYNADVSRAADEGLAAGQFGQDVAVIYNGLQCKAGAGVATPAGASKRSVVILYNIETGSGWASQCQDL